MRSGSGPALVIYSRLISVTAILSFALPVLLWNRLQPIHTGLQRLLMSCSEISLWVRDDAVAGLEIASQSGRDRRES